MHTTIHIHRIWPNGDNPLQGTVSYRPYMQANRDPVCIQDPACIEIWLTKCSDPRLVFEPPTSI